IKKLKSGNNLRKRTGRRKHSRKQEERMVAHWLKFLWRMHCIPKTKPKRAMVKSRKEQLQQRNYTQ
uniref:Uncharacterized protein n=1 Tax=Pan troglodytes TaxID=9598 RepID=A0A2I3TIV0_PANTR